MRIFAGPVCQRGSTELAGALQADEDVDQMVTQPSNTYSAAPASV